jgi:hypothetical protein
LVPTWGPVLGHSNFVKKDERNKVENHKSDNKDKKSHKNESTTKETKTDIIADNNKRDQEREKTSVI